MHHGAGPEENTHAFPHDRSLSIFGDGKHLNHTLIDSMQKGLGFGAFVLAWLSMLLSRCVLRYRASQALHHILNRVFDVDCFCSLLGVMADFGESRNRRLYVASGGTRRLAVGRLLKAYAGRRNICYSRVSVITCF